MIKQLLFVSILLNVLLIAAACFAVQRLGGWKYATLRLQRQTAGIYAHRTGHFEQLPIAPGSIIFLGDSQTQQAEWHELFGDTPAVLNRGITGDNTTGLLERLPEILRHKPRKIFLLIGVNDLIFGNPIEEIALQYQAIVKKIRTQSPDTELFLLSILPVNNQIRKSGTTNQRVESLNARIMQIAHEFALLYVDIATPLKNTDGNLSDQFSEDGLHLNGAGYVVWKKGIEKMVEIVE